MTLSPGSPWLRIVTLVAVMQRNAPSFCDDWDKKRMNVGYLTGLYKKLGPEAFCDELLCRLRLGEQQSLTSIIKWKTMEEDLPRQKHISKTAGHAFTELPLSSTESQLSVHEALLYLSQWLDLRISDWDHYGFLSCIIGAGIEMGSFAKIPAEQEWTLRQLLNCLIDHNRNPTPVLPPKRNAPRVPGIMVGGFKGREAMVKILEERVKEREEEVKKARMTGLLVMIVIAFLFHVVPGLVRAYRS